MNTVKSIKLCLLLVPAMTLSAATSIAEEQRTSPGAAKEQQRTADDAMHPSSSRAEEQRTGPRSADDIRASGSQKHDDKSAAESYLKGNPDNALNADELIGTKLKSSSDSKDIGSIKDLVIDENGQVIAVVVGVGGFLGIREKKVAIPWASLVRSGSERDQGYIFHVNETESSLEAAPEYRRN